MKTLILDSATNILYTCLLVDSEVIYESYVEGKNDHAVAILNEVSNACNKGNIELMEVDNIIVGIGPGSYTGVRMAVTVGKIITTLEPKIKLYSISTLVLMASGSKGRVLSCIDARRGNCFGTIYDLNSNKYIVEEALVEKDKLTENSYDSMVTENSYKVDANNVFSLASIVEEPRTLVPNYLRTTEAERNLKC